VNDLQAGIVAAGAILYYLDMTQQKNISHINSISKIEENDFVRLDKFTIHNLELLHPINREGVS
jgi:DNA mismatch repair protein MutS